MAEQHEPSQDGPPQEPASSRTQQGAERRPARRWWCRHPKPDYPPPTGCRRVYIPIYGYLDADDDHRARVERFFHVPMLVLALLVLPVLGMEYLQGPERQARSSERLQQRIDAPRHGSGTTNAPAPATAPSSAPATGIVPLDQGSGDAHPPAEPSLPLPADAGSRLSRFIDHPAMLVATDIAMIFIWLAFFFEFVIKISIAPSRVQYAVRNWIDIVIIALPMLRVFRGMRALRALRTAQVARYTQVYRLRGVAMKLMRTMGALVLGMEAVRKLKERIQPPSEEDAPPDYTQWSRASLIAEIHRLNELNERLEKQVKRHQRKAKGSASPASASTRMSESENLKESDRP